MLRYALAVGVLFNIFISFSSHLHFIGVPKFLTQWDTFYYLNLESTSIASFENATLLSWYRNYGKKFMVFLRDAVRIENKFKIINMPFKKCSIKLKKLFSQLTWLFAATFARKQNADKKNEHESLHILEYVYTDVASRQFRLLKYKIFVIRIRNIFKFLNWLLLFNLNFSSFMWIFKSFAHKLKSKLVKRLYFCEVLLHNVLNEVI